MKNLLRLAVLLFFVNQFQNNLFAQSTAVGIGQWREHTPFNKAIDITEDNNGIVYCASKFGLFSYSKSDGEVNTLSRLKELSDLEIGRIRFDPVTGVLMIVYENSNLDIIYPDKNVVNLPDIKQKNLIGGKHINAIFFLNGFAYLACEFGIVVVDIARREIKDTYYISISNVNVRGLAFDGTYMIAATDNGIYKANYTDPNIFNYTAWTKDPTLAEPNASYTSATSLNGKFYVVKTNVLPDMDSVLVYDNNQWTPFFNDATEGAHIDTYNNYLIYRNSYKIGVFDGNGVQHREVNNTMYNRGDVRHGILDSGGNFWIADFFNGLVCQRWDNNLSIICPNGPRTESVWGLAGGKGTIWVATGATLGDNPFGYKNGILHFTNNTWTTFDSTNDAIYSSLCQIGYAAVICAAEDPFDPEHAYIGSWGNGILEYGKDGGIAHFTDANSSLHALSAGYVLTGGVAFDEEGNLWSVSAGSTSPVAVRKRDGTWQSYIINDANIAHYGLHNLIVDDFGQKWFSATAPSSAGQGLIAFKENDINSQFNSSYRRLTDQENNGALPNIFVRSLAKDKDGSVWIGTDKGVAVIYNPGNVFTDQSFSAQKVILEQDGYNQYLLETEIVSAIAVDGANRKWFGTYSGGVFLMSPDGTKKILNFNRDNSPLPSNSILGIAINDLTGEVFFGTDKGIISYRGDATEGGDECTAYSVFPNPVRHEYHGPIAISGLVANADVKIADIAGNIVYHTKANGGEAIWNGNNFSGVRAQTGVYIVYVTNEDGTETCTTKMLFAN